MRVERALEAGEMESFVVHDTRQGRDLVAVVLRRGLAGHLTPGVFAREIANAIRLDAPNIVPVLSAGELADGRPYYTMPYVVGESLRARLARGPLPLAVGEAVRVLRDVAQALAYAHAHGVVHRDVKPENVLLSGGVAAVTDFGIAKAITAARTEGERPAGTTADVTLTQLDGTVSTGSGGGASPIRGALNVPAFELQGCTSDQTSVARLMSRLRMVGGVTRVSLAKSDKDTQSPRPAGTGDASLATAGIGACGKGDKPTFDLIAFFEDAGQAIAAATATATPQATADPAAGGTATSSTSTTTAAEVQAK
jgi:hypothetical protein